MTIQHTPSRKAQDTSSARRSAAPTAAKPRTAESDILRLQRQIGNRATTRLIQAKLNVGPAGDRYEQEADRVAQQVMTMPIQRVEEDDELQMKPLAASIMPLVQRAPEEEDELQMKPLAAPLAASITPLVQRAAEEEEELQMKPLAERVQRVEEEEDELQMKPLVQREAMPEEEEEIQMKPDVQRASSGAGFEVGGEFEQQLSASRGSGSPLPAEVRSFMEPRFGADFSGVRLHTGSDAAQLNRAVSAQAFTHGSDIFFNEGKYNPNSSDGQQLLAHELTHTIQQGATRSIKRMPAGLIQRAWDVAVYETANAKGYAALLTKMEGLTPTIGRSRLVKLAAKTDSPEQLSVLLQMGTRNLEIYLASIDAGTLQKLMTLIGKAEFFSVVNDLTKFKIDVKDFLDKNPTATLIDLKAQIASAKNTAGLISAKGTEIAFTTIAAVVGDGKKDEQAAVAAVVIALDKGTLAGSFHGNGEGNLPGVRGAGGYTEYDVTPAPGTPDRGPRRLVVHNTKGFVYYTWNHYGDPGGTNLPAFKRIR